MTGQVDPLDFQELLQCFGDLQESIQAVMDNGIHPTSSPIGTDATNIKNIIKITY